MASANQSFCAEREAAQYSLNSVSLFWQGSWLLKPWSNTNRWGRAVVPVGASTGLHHWHEWDDVFQCGRFDTKDVREGKTTTSTRRGEAVSNLQSLFQFAGLKQIRRGGWGVGEVLVDNIKECWEKHFCLRGRDAFWQTCTINNRVCVGGKKCNHRSVWRLESRQKCCRRQHTEIHHLPVVVSSLGLSPHSVPTLRVKLS